MTLITPMSPRPNNQMKASGSMSSTLMGAHKLSVPAGPSGDCVPAKRIKTEPPDGDIIQVTVPGESGSCWPVNLQSKNFIWVNSFL